MDDLCQSVEDDACENEEDGELVQAFHLHCCHSVFVVPQWVCVEFDDSKEWKGCWVGLLVVAYS